MIIARNGCDSQVLALVCVDILGWTATIATIKFNYSYKTDLFSCLRRIHSWLHTTMTDDRLGNLGVLASI